MSARSFDWAALMRAGLQGLGLHPDQFWALTPAELLMMLGEAPGAVAMGRGGLEALIARFPDPDTAPGKDENDDRDR